MCTARWFAGRGRAGVQQFKPFGSYDVRRHARGQGGSVTATQFRVVLDYLELSQLGVGRLLGVGERSRRNLGP